MDYILIYTATISLLFFVCYLEAFSHTKFCVKNPNNTLCLYPENEQGELCEDFESKKLGKSEKRDIILWHMKIRENVLSPESPARVYWDSTLSSIAERWASRCNLSQDLNRHFGNNSVDERIFSVKSFGDVGYSVSDILKMSEYNLMQEDPETVEFVEKLKDWRVFRIGCGTSKYTIRKVVEIDGQTENSKEKFYEIVCNYLPVKNGSKNLGGRLEIKKKPRSSSIFETSLKKLDKNRRKSPSFSFREEVTDGKFGRKYRGQIPKTLMKDGKGRNEEELVEHSEAEDEEGESLNRDNDYENINGSGNEDQDDYTVYEEEEEEEEEKEEEEEEEQPFDVNELEKEIERRIDEEFGPFKGFLVSTENYGNLSAVSIKMDLRINKVFQEFEQAGAQVTSKGKFVLWAIRDTNGAGNIKPKIYILFTYWIFKFISDLIIDFIL